MVTKKTEETVTDLKDLKDLGTATEAVATETTTEAVVTTEAPKFKEKSVDSLGRSYGTGRRKESVARVWIKPGTGKVLVNGKEQENYFGRKTHLLVINQPFLVTARVGQFDVMCTVNGGGLSGQAGALRHGISRALENFEPELRPSLKKAGMLTRDARAVERKKIGLHKARRMKQWAKR
jgi:small subunit ribosomal protein S9